MSAHGPSATLRRVLLLPLILLLVLSNVACGNGNSGFPKDPGQYPIQPGSITYDGKKYTLIWQDPAGSLHPAEGRDVQMARDERTFLQVGDGSPVMHLKEDEAVTVKGRDRDGEFNTPWLPFLLGYGLGNLTGGGGGYNQPYPGDSYNRGPSYQYPPTDTFGRGDQLNGSVQRSKPEAPDYSKVQPAPYAVSGQSSGTGSGTAATNKSVAPSSGQSGGSGAGSAATNKGTFSSGGSSATSGGGSGLGSGGGTGVGGGSGWSSPSKPSTGSGSSGSSSPSRPPVSSGSKKR
jgi:hypothetical protein